ncbi:putative nucleotidyltransferase, ribonuclease H [Tanacetum coccineum]
MLMAFPFTLKGKARLWINRLSAGSITTWDLLKNAFLSRYRPLFQIIKQTKAIRNFGQECNEPLHLVWERFNDLLYNCPEHKINEHEQLQIFYQGLDPGTRKKADFMGPIPRITPTAGIKPINELSKHSLSWYKEKEYKENDFDKLTKKEKENKQFQKFLRNLQQIHINIPFIEDLEQMPKYAKFMKDLLSKKGKGSETSKIKLNEQCYAVILNKVPHKEKDPEGFTIPYEIGQGGITKALADLGASISLIPYSMFLRLNLGDLKPTRMCIELANKTTQFPKGIAENVMVKIDKFVFPVDFVILDMEEDHRIPIILGRPFLATTHAMIDVFNKKISFEVGDEIITFDLEKSMKFPPSNEDTCHAADIIDLSVLPEIHEDNDNPALFTTNSIDDEKPTPKLKELPSHLEYAFLDNNRELPVIISSLLSDQEKRLLLEVLTKHKKAMAWKIFDIKGISPSFYTHKILMEENSKPTVPPQRRLNPKVQDVVKTEILKLLDAGLIYAISDSPWVSPIHVVPKKGGTTVITNKDNELVPTRTVTGWRDAKFDFSDECIKSFDILRDKLITAPEFTIEIKDKKGTKNLAADHLSRLENPGLDELSEDTIQDNFPDEHLMVVEVVEWRRKSNPLDNALKEEIVLGEDANKGQYTNHGFHWLRSVFEGCNGKVALECELHVKFDGEMGKLKECSSSRSELILALGGSEFALSTLDVFAKKKGFILQIGFSTLYLLWPTLEGLDVEIDSEQVP